MVGTLQSNKAREAVALFDAIHAVDRPSLAEALAKEIARQARHPLLFVEINSGAEPQKGGVLPQDADAFLPSCRDRYGLTISGLMCIPPVDEAPAPHFALTSQIAKRNGLELLSMGMSADFPDRDRLRRDPCACRHSDFRGEVPSGLAMNYDSRLRPKPARQHLKIARPKRDATGGRRETRARDVDKDCAASTGNTWPGVVIDLDDDVIEAVGPPQPVAWFIGRPPKCMVVAPVIGVFAPCIGRTDTANRKPCPRAGEPIGTPPQSHRTKLPVWGAPIALPLVGSDAGVAKRNRQAPRTGAEPPL